jgi:hypothetical protein
MQNNSFFNTEFTPSEVLKQLYREAEVAANYYASPAVPPVMRCDASQGVREYFKKSISVPFRDCGFLKTPPNSVYPVHTDSFRITALNMLMVDTDINFETCVWESAPYQTKPHVVPYVKDQFMILNVQNPHGVINKSKELHRIILSIGILDHDYASILNLHKENKLFNIK